MPTLNANDFPEEPEHHATPLIHPLESQRYADGPVGLHHRARQKAEANAYSSGDHGGNFEFRVIESLELRRGKASW